jgi:glycine cleavage system H protein
MTANTENIFCTSSHEYLVEEGNLLKIGITDFAVEQLGDVVFVELPEVGTKFTKGEVFGTIESVKAASELYLPVSGTIEEINEKAVEEPELINTDCFGQGWLVKVSGYKKAETEEAMPYDDYKASLEEIEE